MILHQRKIQSGLLLLLKSHLIRNH